MSGVETFFDIFLNPALTEPVCLVYFFFFKVILLDASHQFGKIRLPRAHSSPHTSQSVGSRCDERARDWRRQRGHGRRNWGPWGACRLPGSAPSTSDPAPLQRRIARHQQRNKRCLGLRSRRTIIILIENRC